MSLSAELTKLADILLECSIALDHAIEDVFPPDAPQSQRRDARMRKWRRACTKARTEAERLQAMAKVGAKIQARGTGGEG